VITAELTSFLSASEGKEGSGDLQARSGQPLIIHNKSKFVKKIAVHDVGV
jgi:hypothetical protein